MIDTMQQIYTRRSPIAILEETVDSYNALILKEDNFKLDLDPGLGQEAFKFYMAKIETLMDVFSISTRCRLFRNQYTRAYRVLYSDSQLGYIPQIFEAAQEALPFIWVNGQCFIFNSSTLQKGEKLVETYFRLIQLIRLIFLHTENKSKQIPLAYQMQLRERLEQFDLHWINFEKAYIHELITIEEEAKKTIMETLEIEKQLSSYEYEQRIKGKIFYHTEKQFHNSRQRLCLNIAKLNSVANINGKGRDDLTYDILLAAENVLTKISDSQSKSLRNIAEKIRETFSKIREVLRTFSENIDLVDPQLKNNAELVEALTEYELFWEKGKRYFLEQKKQCQILAFSTILEAAKDKYPNFRNLLEFSDPSVFWMIPSVVVLNSLEEEDEGLAQSFLQQIPLNAKLRDQFTNLKETYLKWKLCHSDQKSRHLYNELQKKLIDDGNDSQNLEMALKIKQFAVSLERINPIDWNDMLSVLLTDDP